MRCRASARRDVQQWRECRWGAAYIGQQLNAKYGLGFYAIEYPGYRSAISQCALLQGNLAHKKQHHHRSLPKDKHGLGFQVRLLLGFPRHRIPRIQVSPLYAGVYGEGLVTCCLSLSRCIFLVSMSGQQLFAGCRSVQSARYPCAWVAGES